MCNLQQLTCSADLYQQYRYLEELPGPDYHWLQAAGEKKRLQVVGLGDVGQNVLIGLSMAAGEVIESMGIYDLNDQMVRRMEIEIGQILDASGCHDIPVCRGITDEELFDCDIFLFCATKSVPQVGSGVQDVRMAQYAANKDIAALYARKAAQRQYKGLFVVVSDPVDLLCGAVLRAAAAEEQPLHPDQIVGFGLGVMNARATYYSGRDERFAAYLSEGRAFGPHGADLVIANSTDPDSYDDALSRELTDLTIRANMRVRELGFKPYIAPAMSSVVWSLLALLQGRWHYSAGYLNGVYLGARNRVSQDGRQWENGQLPDQLYRRIADSYHHLEQIIWT